MNHSFLQREFLWRHISKTRRAIGLKFCIRNAFMAIITHAKFHFNRLMLTLIFGIWASEPPRPAERLKRPGLAGLKQTFIDMTGLRIDAKGTCQLSDRSVWEGGCFPRKTTSMPGTPKRQMPLTLKLGHFSQIDIRSILNDKLEINLSLLSW